MYSAGTSSDEIMSILCKSNELAQYLVEMLKHKNEESWRRSHLTYKSSKMISAGQKGYQTNNTHKTNHSLQFTEDLGQQEEHLVSASFMEEDASNENNDSYKEIAESIAHSPYA